MGKIVLRSVDQADLSPFPTVPGLSAHGSTGTRALIDGAGRPLVLWQHDLDAGAEIRFDAPDQGHLLYVWRGAVDVGGEPIGADDVAIIERHGVVTVRADAPARLVHFHAPGPGPKDALARGAVHIRRKGELGQHVHPQTTITLYADSSCESCDLWLHSGETPDGMLNFVEQLHYHSRDEIIFVVSGSMLVGPRRVGAGTALAVAANTVYSFAVNAEKLHFINFRAGESCVSVVEPGTRKGPPMSERSFITSLPLRA